MTINNNVDQTAEQQNIKLTFRICVLSGIVVAVSLLLTVTVFYFARHMEKDRKLFVDSILRMRLDVTSAHLIFDEIIRNETNGHKYEHIQSLLNDANLQLSRLKKGQEQVIWFGKRPDGQQLQSDIRRIWQHLQSFNIVTAHEVELVDKAATGEAMDISHNKQFTGFLRTVDDVERQCNEAISTEIAAFNTIQTAVIALSCILFLVIGAFTRKYYYLQKQAELAKKEFAEKLTLINEDLESIVRISSHDLRSPLVNIQGFANELASDCKELTEIILQVQMPEEKRAAVMSTLNNNIPEEVNFICKSATKMDAVLESLTRLSRLGSEKLQIKSIDMNSLIFDIVDTMQYQINSRDIELVIEDLDGCSGDRTQLTQLFTNLLENAIKYLHPDRRGRIHISSESKANSVVYCVADNGIGIKPEDRSKVFEIFHRVSPKSDDKGQGLGLSIVSRIVERHNGKVWIGSQEQAGSSFYVELPK